MARNRRRNRPNATGRNPHGRFVRLDFRILTALAYRSLTPNARALLTELTMLYNGENNGSLYLAVKDAAARIGVADAHTAGAAFDELQERGFISMTRDAHFKVKASERSRARTWRLNYVPGPGRRPPDLTFLDRQPPAGTRANKRADAGCRALKRYRKANDAERFPDVEFLHCEPDSAERQPGTVGDFYTDSTENCGFSRGASTGNFAIYIANHGDGAGQSDQSTPSTRHGATLPLGWWQPDRSETMARLVYAATLAELIKASTGARALAA